MHRIIIALILFVVILTACSLPSQQQAPSPTAIPTEPPPESALLLEQLGRGNINAAVYSTDGKYILAAFDLGIAVFRTQTMEEVSNFSISEKPLCLTLFGEDQQIALGTETGKLIYATFDPASGQVSASDRPAQKANLGESLPNPQPGFEHYYQAIRAITGSRDGKFVAAASVQRAQVWNLETCQPVLSVPLQQAAVFKLAKPAFGTLTDPIFSPQFSPNGRYVLFARNELLPKGDSYLVDLITGKAVWLMETAARFSGENFLVYKAPDWQDPNSYYLMNLSDFKDVRGIPLPENEGRMLIFSPDGKLVGIPGWATIRMFRTETGEEIGRYNSVYPNHLPEGRFALSNAGWAATIPLLSSPETGVPEVQPYAINLSQPSPGSYQLEKLSLSDIGALPHTPVFSTAGDSFLYFHHNILAQVDLITGETRAFYDSSIAGITTLTFSSDGGTLAAGQQDFSIELFDARQGLTQTRSFELSPRLNRSRWYTGISGLAFTPDGAILATASSDGTLELLTLDDSQPPVEIRPYEDVVETFALAISPDGRTLATGGNEQTVRLWQDFPTGNPTPSLLDDVDVVTALAFAPAGDLVAAGTKHGAIRLWRADGTFERTLAGHTGRVTGVAFSPDGLLLASAAEDGMLRLWRVNDGTEITSVDAGEALLSLVFDPRGEFVAVGSQAGNVFFWSLKENHWLGMLAGTSGIRAVALNPDGTNVAIGAENGQLQLWQLRNADGRLAALPEFKSQSSERDCVLSVHEQEITRTVVAGAPAQLSWSFTYIGYCGALDEKNILQTVDLPEIVSKFTFIRLPSQGSIRLTAQVLPVTEGSFDYAWKLSAPDEAAFSAKLDVIPPAGDLTLPASLYFISENDSLIRLERDGSTQSILVEAPVNCMDVSSNGEIAYIQNDALMLADADGGNRRTLLPIGGCPAWSPDGRLIAFSLNGVRVLDVQTGEVRLLREDLHAYGKNARYYGETHSWSPFSNKFIASVGGWETSSLIVFDVPTADRFGLTGWSSPSWSRNGETIYTGEYDYQCFFGQPPFVAGTEINLRQPEFLAGGTDEDLRGGLAPFETADGRLLAFTSQLSGDPCADAELPIPLTAAYMYLSSPGIWYVDSYDRPIFDPVEALWWGDGSLAIVKLGDGMVIITYPFSEKPNTLLPIYGGNLRWGR